VLYVLAIPMLGYPLALGLLAAAVAWLGGARGPSLALFAAGLAAVFWVLFVAVLGIPFPAGALFGGH
jgi:hypothetical protein